MLYQSQLCDLPSSVSKVCCSSVEIYPSPSLYFVAPVTILRLTGGIPVTKASRHDARTSDNPDTRIHLQGCS